MKRSSYALVIAVLGAALLLVALRTEVIRLRYRLAESLEREQQLLELQRTLTVEVRSLRDPNRLSQRATALGFGRAERVIDLPVVFWPPRDLQPVSGDETPR